MLVPLCLPVGLFGTDGLREGWLPSGILLGDEVIAARSSQVSGVSLRISVVLDGIRVEGDLKEAL
jgi:hypothetical protein